MLDVQVLSWYGYMWSAVVSPVGCTAKICDICGIVLCNKTANFRVAFYCGQPKWWLSVYYTSNFKLSNILVTTALLLTTMLLIEVN